MNPNKVSLDREYPDSRQETQERSLTLQRVRNLPPHLLVTASAWGSRLINMSVQIISVRLLLPSLGVNQYAVYALLSSLAAWFLLCDLGIGYSLQNFISESRAANRSYSRYLTTAMLSSALLALLSLGLLYAVTPLLAPRLLGHFAFLSDLERKRLFLAAGCFFTINGVSSIGLKVWYAQQKGYHANLLTGAAALVSLASIACVTHYVPAHRLVWVIVASTAPAALAALVSLVWVVLADGGGVGWDGRVLRHLMGRASQFWVSGMLALAVLQVDYIIMAQKLPGRDIVIYNLAAKVFGVSYALYTAALQALWPVIAERLAKNEWDAVMRDVRRYLALGTLFMVINTVLFAAFAGPVIAVLSPREHFVIPTLFILLFGAYQLVGIWTGTFATVLQSKNDLSPFLTWGIAQAVLSAPLQWILITRLGLYGVVLGLIASYLLTAAWALPLRVRRHMRLHRQSGLLAS